MGPLTFEAAIVLRTRPGDRREQSLWGFCCINCDASIGPVEPSSGTCLPRSNNVLSHPLVDIGLPWGDESSARTSPGLQGTLQEHEDDEGDKGYEHHPDRPEPGTAGEGTEVITGGEDDSHAQRA